MLAHEPVKVRYPGAVTQPIAAGVTRRMPGIARALDVVAQRIGKGSPGAAADSAAHRRPAARGRRSATGHDLPLGGGPPPEPF